MIAVDTNLLVRHLVQDDAQQAFSARRILSDGAVYVSNVVLAELVWVLESCYEYPKSDVLDVLRELGSTVDIVFSSRPVASDAVAAFAQQGADFADWLIYYEALEQGCSEVFSFDKACIKTGRFRSPPTV